MNFAEAIKAYEQALDWEQQLENAVESWRFANDKAYHKTFVYRRLDGGMTYYRVRCAACGWLYLNKGPSIPPYKLYPKHEAANLADSHMRDCMGVVL